MINLSSGLLLAILIMIVLGSLGYLRSRRPAGKNQSIAMTVFAYGMLSSSLALIPISLFHIHGGTAAVLHIHGVGETFQALSEECGLPIFCAINELLIVTAGVLFFAFVLNQAASHVMLRRFRNREDIEMTRSLRAVYDVDDLVSLYVVKDAKPDAYSFAILELGRFFIPRGRDVVIITTSLMELLDKDELQTVLAHELAHVTNKDNRYIPFFQALSSLMFFDPLMRLLKNRVVRRGEFMADREAAISTGKPLGLARALGKILLYGQGKGSKHTIYSAFSGGQRKVILERIRMLIRFAESMGQNPQD